MKDISVEELEDTMKLVIKSDAVDIILKLAITNCWNERLRRFEVLEKENKNLRCCGNCVNHKQGHITGCSYKKGMSSNEYCDLWQSDGLMREERSK
jgi:hypothetical protein